MRTSSSAYDQACSLQFGLSTRDATQGQDLFGALQSSDWKEAIAEIQDVHLHTKARMGDIPIVAVGGGVDGCYCELESEFESSRNVIILRGKLEISENWQPYE